MLKIAAILAEVAFRLQAAWGLDASHVLLAPRTSELPPDGEDYAGYRFEVLNGRWEAGAYDALLLRVYVAAELTDPGVARSADRIALVGMARDRLTPTFAGVGVYPQIDGWETPVVTEAHFDSMDDSPGRLFVGMIIEGEVTLGRGGYEG